MITEKAIKLEKRIKIFNSISYHREDMDELHGEETLPMLSADKQLVILMEEVGEMARARIEDDYVQFKAEAYDVAQVIIAILEGLE